MVVAVVVAHTAGAAATSRLFTTLEKRKSEGVERGQSIELWIGIMDKAVQNAYNVRHLRQTWFILSI